MGAQRSCKVSETKLRIGFGEATFQAASFVGQYQASRIISTKKEKRYFCFGKAYDEVLTVRFCIRRNGIRIFGAGFWREGRRFYEEVAIQ